MQAILVPTPDASCGSRVRGIPMSPSRRHHAICISENQLHIPSYSCIDRIIPCHSHPWPFSRSRHTAAAYVVVVVVVVAVHNVVGEHDEVGSTYDVRRYYHHGFPKPAILQRPPPTACRRWADPSPQESYIATALRRIRPFMRTISRGLNIAHCQASHSHVAGTAP